ncbi:CaiB/BaiF CoA transferase family protein [Roseibium sp. SCP14]|uniref:CaiB/BaiF CoA transferase family protein n=1 Tax=Roseibium sp. SCP14 TaxID=3141375 RepID=UPI0033390E7D
MLNKMQPQPGQQNSADQATGPLRGLKVLDIATIIAGPLAGGLLADFGADVLKVEMPGDGDGLRALRPHKNGVSLWAKVINRNKKGITLDLRTPEGVEIVKNLVQECDVLIENFRPGTIEKWGIGPEDLWAVNPKLTILRVSAFGQEGPYANRPGFARVADAMSGFLSLCGQADSAPMHPGYPIADSVTGLFGALGILMALLERQTNPDAKGQVVSVSLFESMFRILDFLPIEYDQLGEVRQRTGNRNPYAAPGNCYQARDDQWCTVAASTQTLFERLASAIGREDLIIDPRFQTNVSRLQHADQLDEIIGDWFAQRSAEEACSELEAFSVTAAKVRTIDELFTDPQVIANQMIVGLEDDELGSVRMQGVTPNFSRTPGSVHSPGPALGADNNTIYAGRLGLSDAEITTLRNKQVI